MKKFVVQSKKGKTVITEVECELVTPMEDPSIMWIPNWEYMAKILKPTSFHMKFEKQVEGKKEIVLVPDVWYSHAFFNSLVDATKYAERIIKESFEFEARKYGKEFSVIDVLAAIKEIEVVLL
jgi:hypothetical protein